MGLRCCCTRALLHLNYGRVVLRLSNLCARHLDLLQGAYILERERRATRATIKALPASPHLPRPYGDIPPQERRPLQNTKSYVQDSYVWRITWPRAYGHSRGHAC